MSPDIIMGDAVNEFYCKRHSSIVRIHREEMKTYGVLNESFITGYFFIYFYNISFSLYIYSVY